MECEETIVIRDNIYSFSMESKEGKQAVVDVSGATNLHTLDLSNTEVETVVFNQELSHLTSLFIPMGAIEYTGSIEVSTATSDLYLLSLLCPQLKDIEIEACKRF